MICVATNQRDSFENIDWWRNEIQTIEPKKPIMLVLTKSDLQDQIEDSPVTFEELK